MKPVDLRHDRAEYKRAFKHWVIDKISPAPPDVLVFVQIFGSDASRGARSTSEEVQRSIEDSTQAFFWVSDNAEAIQ